MHKKRVLLLPLLLLLNLYCADGRKEAIDTLIRGKEIPHKTDVEKASMALMSNALKALEESPDPFLKEAIEALNKEPGLKREDKQTVLLAHLTEIVCTKLQLERKVQTVVAALLKTFDFSEEEKEEAQLFVGTDLDKWITENIALLTLEPKEPHV